MRLIALIILFFASSAFAVVPAIPGDGVAEAETGTFGSCGAGKTNAFVNLAGTLSTGCDLLRAAPDQDGDGYTSDGSVGTSGTAYIDCDDTNRRIYPGTVSLSGCTGSDYKSCPTTGGSLSGCTTGPLAEGARNYYISCTAGNDANAGTYASPFKTLGKVSGGSGGSGLPASPVTLQPDDHVYIIAGTCNTSFTMTVGGAPNISVLMSPGASGTSGHPITTSFYPGSTATLSIANGIAINVADKDYTTWDGLVGSSAETVDDHSGSFFAGNGANYTTIKNSYVTSSVSGSNNGGCIKLEHSNNSTLQYNYLRDCVHSGAGLLNNIAGIVYLDDENTSAGNGFNEGYNHFSNQNVIWYSSYSNTVNGACWFEKHGSLFADTGANGHRVTYSYCINPRRVFFWSGSGLRAKGIFAYNDGSGNATTTSLQQVAVVDDGGTGGYHESNKIQYSTFINFSMLQWKCPILLGTPGLAIDHNIFVDNDASYSTANDEGMISIAPYFSDAAKTSMESGGWLVSNSNLFYNAAAALNFGYFNESAAGACGQTAGAAGANYTFANWKATVGQDASSFVEDPTHSSLYVPGSANSTGKGWTAAAETGGGGGGSSTSSRKGQRNGSARKGQK